MIADKLNFSEHCQLLLKTNRFLLFQVKPDNGFDTTWSLSMEQCKISHQPHYLFGDVALNDPDDACNISQHQFQIAWIGVAQQVYTSIDQGK